jgi:hypothetical protein
MEYKYKYSQEEKIRPTLPKTIDQIAPEFYKAFSQKELSIEAYQKLGNHATCHVGEAHKFKGDEYDYSMWASENHCEECSDHFAHSIFECIPGHEYDNTILIDHEAYDKWCDEFEAHWNEKHA